MDALVVNVDKLFTLTKINSSFHMDMFMYTAGKITHRSGNFGDRVKKAYKALSADNCCWCLLTDDMLPKETVIGGHLFKYQWKTHTDLIGIPDINDTRNGLPLWKPVEWAFDTGR